ncbi:MAG: glycosyltransferase [Paracoccaceae bacterium]
MTDHNPAADTPTATPQERFDSAPILIVTRFSFLGDSGWKSEASRDAELLFEESRLKRRLELFRAVTLPSLKAQTDQGFHHFVLTSDQMPEWALEALRDVCRETYGDESRFSVVAGKPGRARRALRFFMERKFEQQTVIQVVLDDDDGLAANFIATLRTELTLLDEEPPEDLHPLPYLISFANGYGLSLRDDAGGEVAVYGHRYPFINLGLSMVGTRSGKNILAIAHKKSHQRLGGKLIESAPMFIRCIHDVNDSRVQLGRNWDEFENWQLDEALRHQFPGLFAADAPWAAELRSKMAESS